MFYIIKYKTILKSAGKDMPFGANRKLFFKND
jgi:hypothetical protein